jgi:hypothetical protein
MHGGSPSRFDAQTVVRSATVNEGARFELEFCDAEGNHHVVSLPVQAAVELGCLICDASENAPYLFGGVQAPRRGKR